MSTPSSKESVRPQLQRGCRLSRPHVLFGEGCSKAGSWILPPGYPASKGPPTAADKETAEEHQRNHQRLQPSVLLSVLLYLELYKWE